jgi:hypothetical protein
MNDQNKLECFVPGRPFLPNLMFVGRARSQPFCGVPERCFTNVLSSFAHIHSARLERLTRDKQSSLLQTFVNYDCQRFCSIGPCLLESFELGRILKGEDKQKIDLILKLNQQKAVFCLNGILHYSDTCDIQNFR